MKGNDFRDGFMAAVVVFIGIAVGGMVIKNIFPTVGEAFVLESVPEYSQTVDDTYSEQSFSSVSQPSSVPPVPQTQSTLQSAPVTSSDLPSSPEASYVQSTEYSVHIDDPVPQQSVSAAVPPDEPISQPEQSFSEISSDIAPVSESSYSEPQQNTPTESRIPSVSSAPEPVGIININTATSHELQRLNGIGEVKAQAIIDYREQHGGFSSVDDLINVKGIGEKTLEKIRANVTV